MEKQAQEELTASVSKRKNGRERPVVMAIHEYRDRGRGTPGVRSLIGSRRSGASARIRIMSLG